MSREYPERPIIGVGAVILDGDRVVVVQRGSEPHKGEWSLPGGVVEVGETLPQAVAREAREETGLEVEVLQPVEIVERITPAADGRFQYHFVLVDYLCRVTGGELRAGEDAADARWVSLDDMDALQLTPPAAEVVRKAAGMIQALRGVAPPGL